MQAGRIGAVGNLGDHWDGENGEKIFARATRRPVTLINDADAAGLAELRFGAARKQRGTVVLLTVTVWAFVVRRRRQTARGPQPMVSRMDPGQ